MPEVAKCPQPVQTVIQFALLQWKSRADLFQFEDLEDNPSY